MEPTARTAIDAAVEGVLERAGAPGASVAVVKDGRVAYVRVYGLARVEPARRADVGMPYAIGSVSKQFTAAAVLMLAEEGRLSLDDRVNRWLPELTRADDVSVRQLLSMTAGYQDYWPQDYVFEAMRRPASAADILDGWARKPLDFEPGARWQYSNTNYVAAGVIVERVSGESLFAFLQRRVFEPLGMESVVDVDRAALGEGEPAGYLRNGLGPLRPAPKEGPGWLFAAGGLAMTASDLARWDLSIIGQTLLKPESYRLMQTEVRLTDGTGTGYGLGVRVTGGRRRAISHDGEVSGFTAYNVVYPDERAAVVVLVNLDATSAPVQIGSRVARVLLPPPATAPAPVTTAPSVPTTRPTESVSREAAEQARGVFASLQQGRVDRRLFTENGNAYFTEQALADFASGLGPLGEPRDFVELGQADRGGMTVRRYGVRFGEGRAVRVWAITTKEGKLEQFMVVPE